MKTDNQSEMSIIKSNGLASSPGRDVDYFPIPSQVKYGDFTSSVTIHCCILEALFSYKKKEQAVFLAMNLSLVLVQYYTKWLEVCIRGFLQIVSQYDFTYVLPVNIFCNVSFFRVSVLKFKEFYILMMLVVRCTMILTCWKKPAIKERGRKRNDLIENVEEKVSLLILLGNNILICDDDLLRFFMCSKRKDVRRLF